MNKLTDFPRIIKTPGLVLRTVMPTAENAEKIFAIIEQNRDYLTAWQGLFDYIHNTDDVLRNLNFYEQQVEKNEGILFGIYKDDNLIGRIRFINKQNQECEIGFWLIEKETGNGYMSEAVTALETELFKFGFNKIILDIDAGNTPSENVALRNGYTLDKRLPMASWAKCVGKCDSLIYVKYQTDIKISLRPMTVDEAWDFILHRHHYFHTELKQFGYTINSFVPNPKKYPIIQEMFDKEILTKDDVETYSDFFKNKIYNVEHLTKYDDILKSWVIPMMKRGINKFLTPVLKSWGASIPKELEILCTYGCGAAYNVWSDTKPQIIFRVSHYPDNPESMLNTLLHEFIHIMIEKQIIKKYKVPQDFKERIVDIIGQEFFDGYNVDDRFKNPFVDKYITPDAIKNDLSGAVKEMMDVYNNE